jgi:diguanylate cyclase (GGDEF)-like protein
MHKSRIKAGGDFTYNALHDPVTGLYNHSAYEMLLRDADQSHIAVLIADIDNFIEKKRESGAEKMERVIRLAANVLRASFRSVDFICRIREDEFVVIMTRVDQSMQQMVFEKVVQINEALMQPGDDLPAISFSVGVAFGDRENPEGDIFHDADIALQRTLCGEPCRFEVF